MEKNLRGKTIFPVIRNPCLLASKSTVFLMGGENAEGSTLKSVLMFKNFTKWVKLFDLPGGDLEGFGCTIFNGYMWIAGGARYVVF